MRTEMMKTIVKGRHQEGKYQEGKHQEGKHQEGKHQEGKHQEGKHREEKHREEKHQEVLYREEPSFSGAFFTVEAALVMPVVLSVLVMVIYLSFYLYDRCVMAQDCYVLSYRQSIEKGKTDRISQDKIHSQFGNKLFMLSALETASSSGGTISVRSNARMSPPLFGLPVFEQERTWDLGVERKAKKTDPPKDYRRVRRTLFLASRILPDGKAGD